MDTPLDQSIITGDKYVHSVSLLTVGLKPTDVEWYYLTVTTNVEMNQPIITAWSVHGVDTLILEEPPTTILTTFATMPAKSYDHLHAFKVP